MELLDKIKRNARKINKRIVLPESSDERILKAADILLKESIAQIILIGDQDVIYKNSELLGLKSINKAVIVNPKKHPKKDEYASLLFNLRKSKGMTKEDAKKIVEDPLYLGALMIKNGDADGEVAGAINSTANVLRPAFQIIKTQKGISIVSSIFIMILKDKMYGDDGVLIFADCAVNPDPNEQELAEIAISSADTAKVLADIEPRVAMLSFSTMGSASHPLVDKVKKATEIAKAMRPDLLIDGELQADAALVPEIAKSKSPNSLVSGKANVLIFPDLNSANISYKLVNRLAGAEAVGPIIQGLAAPINDLSRGCSVNDIVNVTAITANMAKKYI